MKKSIQPMVFIITLILCFTLMILENNSDNKSQRTKALVQK
jgi:hypothetical protein